MSTRRDLPGNTAMRLGQITPLIQTRPLRWPKRLSPQTKTTMGKARVLPRAFPIPFSNKQAKNGKRFWGTLVLKNRPPQKTGRAQKDKSEKNKKTKFRRKQRPLLRNKNEK